MSTYTEIIGLIRWKFAKAAGARVVATTSSAEKADRLKKLGADHVINYKENPNWGQLAKSLTPNNEGVSLVVEVGGPSSARQVCSSLITVSVIRSTSPD